MRAPFCGAWLGLIALAAAAQDKPPEADAAGLATLPVQSLPDATTPALVEEAAVNPPAQLDTVVVTAQKREATVQKTPISPATCRR